MHKCAITVLLYSSASDAAYYLLVVSSTEAALLLRRCVMYCPLLTKHTGLLGCNTTTLTVAVTALATA
jgi:hypothetical protein